MSIQQLPDHVIAQIKSSTTITSINGVICGLVKNSLDAGASKITISVDYARGNCSIEDNGSGILPADFHMDGGLGKLHYTSRRPTRPDVHGRCGTFLASVAALSLIFITSHHQAHHSHNSIKIHNSEVLARCAPSPPDQRLLTFNHGTRVAVRDLFGLMPVRVKQRATAAVDKLLSSRDWDNLKREVVALLLAWPGHVTISLRESSSQQSSVLRNGEATVETEPHKERRPRLVTRVSKTFYQAGLLDGSSLGSWISLKATAGAVAVDGAVCLSPVATKRTQFISIGIQPVSNDRGSNILYEEINRLFANSSFGVEEQLSDLDEAEKNRRLEDRRYKTVGYATGESKAKKGVDRWPMYYIRINPGRWDDHPTSHDVEEVLDERRPNLEALIDVLRAMIYEFLKRHNFRPVHYKSRKKDSPTRSSVQSDGNELCKSDTPTLTPLSVSLPTPRADAATNHKTKPFVKDLATTRLRLPHASDLRSRSESPFDSWTRVKSGRQLPTMIKDIYYQEPKILPTNMKSTNNTPPLLNSAGKLLRPPFSHVDESSSLVRQNQTETLSEDYTGEGQLEDGHEIRWVNPATMQKITIDAQTGFIIAPLEGSGNNSRTSNSVSVKRLRLQAQQPEVAISPWLRDFLSSWKNPVFEAAELRMPVVFDGTKTHQSMNVSGANCHSCHKGILEVSSNIEGRISKQSLADAEVVAQVDRKFILAKVPLSSVPNTSYEHQSVPSLLVVIDQHAADERCRVEGLMEGYFDDTSKSATALKAKTEVLEKILHYEVSHQEHCLFERYSSELERWGIVYQLTPNSSMIAKKAKSPSFLKVVGLPPSIAERCQTDPRLLINLLRKEVWKLDETSHGQPHQVMPSSTKAKLHKENGQELHWLSKLHGCPQGILDMINSRACRSAIMFNDVLSRKDCKDLLRRLASCAFPFQCAHGRPSMVPLVDMGDDRINKREGLDNTTFREQFKRWKTSMGDNS